MCFSVTGFTYYTIFISGGVQVVEVSKNSAIIQWTDGASNGRPILHYTVAGRTNWNTTWFNISERRFEFEWLLNKNW